ncbi:thiol-disulfide thioredoxin [Haloferula helveola]|uniref:Thiol-disulfide thioredoxin n=1 Tax=Haloferula helveola TaxID=490095 RepID=A0ABM7RF63_9BACT|nr:thiol-disulfide thioredoxin [Haloferula helveola]
MKIKPILLAAACAATLGQALAGGEGWTHDFAAAKKQAAEEDKSLLIDFTGSDWCGWCIKLNEEVFQHDPFKEGVKDKFVLVELDFLRDKSKLSEETQKQNEELQSEYGIKGFPTILLTDAEGKPFARTGYQQGGPEKYVKHLDELLEARKTRDEAFAKAEKSEGVDKAKALVEALNAMGLEDEMVASFYGDTIETIKAADPEDETGFVKQIEMKQKFGKFESELNNFARARDHEKALAHVDETLASGEFEGEQKQQVALYKGMILAQQQEFDAALKAMDEAKEIAPDSELAGRIEDFKGRISQMQAQVEASKADEKGDSDE